MEAAGKERAQSIDQNRDEELRALRDELGRATRDLKLEREERAIEVDSLVKQNAFIRSELASENARMRKEAKSMRRVVSQMSQDLSFMEEELCSSARQMPVGMRTRSLALKLRWRWLLSKLTAI